MMRSTLLRSVVVLVLGCAIYWGVLFWKTRNDGFAIDKIATTLPNRAEWQIPLSKESVDKVNQIVKQPFHYLGHGFQFYAFESEDGQYVLKFMRHQRLEAPKLYDWLPDLSFLRTQKEKKSAARTMRTNDLFSSLKLAYTAVPDETGLVAVHLNKTKNNFGRVTLVDLRKKRYQVALDGTEFVLQERATLVKPTIKQLMKEGDLNEAKRRIEQIFALLVSCAKKGILDADRALISKNNMGFLKTRAIYIDAGKLKRSDTINTKKRFSYDLGRLKPLYRWLIRHYPPLAVHFEREEKKALAAFQ